mmetsp:Transcript_3287/g.4985  ORF Transcript_3287/g.4985 Transcript_3287/m.4985 type:complete len:263 (+) Transcript_3287:95-883(+)
MSNNDLGSACTLRKSRSMNIIFVCIVSFSAQAALCAELLSTSHNVSKLPAIQGMNARNIVKLLSGQGINVAVISSSFDTLGDAKVDVLAGHLPGEGNPHGYLQPVYVLVDMKADDEGRAMLQTVHALAPSAGLCFATGYGPTGVEGLAQRILQLAEPPCNADIILDDVSFFDNPYVDGPAARAVESVVSKHNVLYVSAAGNRRFFTREFAAEFVTAAHVEQKHLRRITSILSWTRNACSDFPMIWLRRGRVLEHLYVRGPNF